MRQHGEITRFDLARNFGFITPEKGKDLFFNAEAVRRDWKLSRAWAYGTGLPVTFEAVRGIGKGDRAEDVAPLFDLEEAGDLESLREVSAVHHAMPGGKFVFLTRPCGDILFAHIEDVVEGFENRWEFLKKDFPVFHGVGYGFDKKVRAVKLELFAPHELVDPEPEVVEPTVEILQPENRSKTLYELIRERRR